MEDIIYLVNCNELDITHNNTIDFKSKESQLSYFFNKRKLVLDNNIYTRSNTTLTIDKPINELQIYNYCIIYDSVINKNYFYFIANKMYVNEYATSIILKLDVIQTYLFDMNLNYSSLIDRGHLRERDIYGDNRIIYENLFEDEGLELGEYVLTNKYKVYDYNNKGGYIVTTTDMLGTTNGGSGSTPGYDKDKNFKNMISVEFFVYLKALEGYLATPRNLGDGVMTIGYGTTNSTNYYNMLHPSCTERQASEIMLKSIKEVYLEQLKSDIAKRTNPKTNEVDAFVDLAYNCGVSGCKSSPMFQNYINNKSLNDCIVGWNIYRINSGTIHEEGLRNRRQREIDMFLKGSYPKWSIANVNTGGIITDNNGKGYIPPELNYDETLRDKIIASARTLIGKPYIWGGNYPPLGDNSGTDCSGLCQWAYYMNGQNISRTTYTQIKQGREVTLEQLKKGDLVFSNFSSPDVPEHVYLFSKYENGKYYCIEAYNESQPIREIDFNPIGKRFRNLLD